MGVFILKIGGTRCHLAAIAVVLALEEYQNSCIHVHIMFMPSRPGLLAYAAAMVTLKSIIWHNTAFGDYEKKLIWQYYCNAEIVHTCKYIDLLVHSNWWYCYAKMRSAICYSQKIRCSVICKMSISCYVLCNVKWLLLCVMCWKMASAMCYVKPLEGPQWYNTMAVCTNQRLNVKFENLKTSAILTVATNYHGLSWCDILKYTEYVSQRILTMVSAVSLSTSLTLLWPIIA